MNDEFSMWDGQAEEIQSDHQRHLTSLASAAVEPLWPYLSGASTVPEFEQRLALSGESLLRSVASVVEDPGMSRDLVVIASSGLRERFTEAYRDREARRQAQAAQDAAADRLEAVLAADDHVAPTDHEAKPEWDTSTAADLCDTCGWPVSKGKDGKWTHDAKNPVQWTDKRKTSAKTAAGPIAWQGDSHFGVGYLWGKAPNGNIYEVYFNPNFNPTPCSWAMYGPDGDTGLGSQIERRGGFTTMQEAMKDAEQHAVSVTASKTSADQPKGFDDLDKGICRTCGGKILGWNGNWRHDPREPLPDHPAGSVAGEAHKPMPKEGSRRVAASGPFKAIVIEPSGNGRANGTVVREVTMSGLSDMQAAVKGYIEPVQLKDGVTMWVNEEGNYQFSNDDVNWVAGDVAGLGGNPLFMLKQPILGPVVLTGSNDATGETTDVPEAARRWCKRVGREAGAKFSSKTSAFGYDSSQEPCCMAYVTSGGVWHEPGCPVGDRLPDPGHTSRRTADLSCPACHSSNVVMTIAPGGGGSGPSGRWRMGDPGGSQVIQCRNCGVTSPMPVRAAASRTAAKDNGTVYDTPADLPKPGDTVRGRGGKIGDDEERDVKVVSVDGPYGPFANGGPGGATTYNWDVKVDAQDGTQPYSQTWFTKSAGKANRRGVLVGLDEYGSGTYVPWQRVHRIASKTASWEGLPCAECGGPKPDKLDGAFTPICESCWKKGAYEQGVRMGQDDRYGDDVSWASPSIRDEVLRGIRDGRSGKTAGADLLSRDPDSDAANYEDQLAGNTGGGIHVFRDDPEEKDEFRGPTFVDYLMHGLFPSGATSAKTANVHIAETHPPYEVEERGGKYVVVNAKGDVKGTHDTKEQARGQQKALYANVPGASEQAEKKSSRTAGFDIEDTGWPEWASENFGGGQGTKTIDGVTCHFFASTAQAYNESQVSDDIHDGDVLAVPSEGVFGFLNAAWPIAVTEAHGEFHGLKPGFDVADIDGGKYVHAAEVARSLASGRTASLHTAARYFWAEVPEGYERTGEISTHPCDTCGAEVPFETCQTIGGGFTTSIAALDDGSGSDAYSIWCARHMPEKYRGRYASRHTAEWDMRTKEQGDYDFGYYRGKRDRNEGADPQGVGFGAPDEPQTEGERGYWDGYWGKRYSGGAVVSSHHTAAEEDPHAYNEGYHDGYMDGSHKERGGFDLQNSSRSSESEYAAGYYAGFDAATSTEDSMLPVMGLLAQATEQEWLEAEGAFFHHPQAPNQPSKARIPSGPASPVRSDERQGRAEEPETPEPLQRHLTPNANRVAVNEQAQGAERYQNLPPLPTPQWIRDEWESSQNQPTPHLDPGRINPFSKETLERVMRQRTQPTASRRTAESDWPRTKAECMDTDEHGENIRNYGACNLCGMGMGKQSSRRTAADLEGFEQNDPFEQSSIPVSTRPRVLPQEHRPGPDLPDFGEPSALPQMGSGDMGESIDPMLPTQDQMLTARLNRIAHRVKQDNPTMSREQARQIAEATVARYPEMMSVTR